MYIYTPVVVHYCNLSVQTTAASVRHVQTIAVCVQSRISVHTTACSDYYMFRLLRDKHPDYLFLRTIISVHTIATRKKIVFRKETYLNHPC